jgi:hypothetical protein
LIQNTQKLNNNEDGNKIRILYDPQIVKSQELYEEIKKLFIKRVDLLVITDLDLEQELKNLGYKKSDIKEVFVLGYNDSKTKGGIAEGGYLAFSITTPSSFFKI